MTKHRLFSRQKLLFIYNIIVGGDIQKCNEWQDHSTSKQYLQKNSAI